MTANLFGGRSGASAKGVGFRPPVFPASGQIVPPLRHLRTIRRVVPLDRFGVEVRNGQWVEYGGSTLLVVSVVSPCCILRGIVKGRPAIFRAYTMDCQVVVINAV